MGETDPAEVMLDDPLAGLLETAGGGDASSLRRLLDAVAPSMVRVVGLVLGPTRVAEVDDVVQEALLAFVGALGAFRGDSSVVRYARQIAARVAAGHLRRTVRREAHHERYVVRELDAPRTPPSDGRSRAVLTELLASLPDEQSETLVLRVVLGCSIREIAEMTETPRNTVRSRLRLAKEALRARIGEAGIHEDG